MIGLEELAVDAVESGKVVDVGQENGGLDDVLVLVAGLLQDGADAENFRHYIT